MCTIGECHLISMINALCCFYWHSSHCFVNYFIFFFSYNQQGTLKEARWPTGEVTNLSSQVNQSSAVVTYRVPDRTETVSIVSRKDDRWRETISQGRKEQFVFIEGSVESVEITRCHICQLFCFAYHSWFLGFNDSLLWRKFPIRPLLTMVSLHPQPV